MFALLFNKFAHSIVHVRLTNANKILLTYLLAYYSNNKNRPAITQQKCGYKNAALYNSSCCKTKSKQV